MATLLYHGTITVHKPPELAEHLIDVSNYQGNLTSSFFSSWGARGFSGLIVQAVTGNDGRSYTRQQCQAALDHGWELNGYIWCPSNYNARLALFNGFKLNELYLDVEESQLTWDEIDAGFRACDSYISGVTGMYTRANMFNPWTNKYSFRKLWVAYYDNVPDVNVGFKPFGGWTEAYMKQYTEHPLDQNVRRIS